MSPMRKVLIAALIALGCKTEAKDLAAATPPPGAPPAALAAVAKLEPVARGLDQPLLLTHAPGDPARLYIVEQTGRIRVLASGKVAPAPFLDLSKSVSRGGEQGLLGLAFHPRFAENGLFIVDYTDRGGDTRVVRYHAGPGGAEPASARELLTIKQPYANHNGGNVIFGPDGKLYIGTGDGGAAFDPHGNGQNRAALLGKMLRLDVDAADAKPEIMAIGLRNPWRYEFDRATGDLYIADVGQNKYEEVDVVPLAALGGKNFGWNVLEGFHCLSGKACDASGMQPPAIEYTHQDGCSITGGFVYRGVALPELDGIYFYSDYCTGLLRGFRWKDGKVSDHWDWKGPLDPGNKLAKVSSFGEDAEGELYVVSLEGTIWKLVRR
jgi:glucose/arabinose dehydrogenase